MKEESKAVASTRSIVFWCILIFLSLFLIVEARDLSTFLTWIIASGLVGFLGFLFRARGFVKASDELLRNGEVSKPYDHRKQIRSLILIIIFTILAFFAPLFLSAELTIGLWLGSLVGIIDGWILGILFYNFFLLQWQDKHSGKLFTLQKWSGRSVTHIGLSFVRSSESS